MSLLITENEKAYMDNFLKYLVELNGTEKKTTIKGRNSVRKYFRKDAHLAAKVLNELEYLGMIGDFSKGNKNSGEIYTFYLDKIRKYLKGKEEANKTV